ncbi:hypothetical protein [Kaarinaea lacus]
MLAESNNVLIIKQYSVVSVEKTKPPVGAEGDNWYRYVVARDDSQIVGSMRGSLQQVTTYAREFVDNLNNRATTNKGRSNWSSSLAQKTPPSKV